MASTDAKPVPQKNVAYRITFPIFDADGDLVTGATGLDSEISKDGGAMTDCTNEATEIGSSGIYYLDLTSTEMNADTVAVIVKTTSSGAKTTPVIMYPEEAGDIRVNVTAYGGTAGTFSAGRPEVNTTHVSGTLQTAGDIIADTNDIQTRLPAALVSGRMDASVGAMAANVMTAAATAADYVTELQSGLSTLTAGAISTAVWDAATASYGSAGTYGALVETNLDAAISTRLASASYTAPLDAAGTRTAIGLATANLDTQLTAIDDYLDTELAAVKAKTDQLTFTVAGQVDANAESMNGAEILGNGSSGNLWRG